MRRSYIYCDYKGCERSEVCDEDDSPKWWNGWGEPHYCPRHNNPYVAWKPRVKTSLDVVVESIYKEAVKEQLEGFSRFAKLMTKYNV